MLFSDLDKSSIELVLRQLRKLPWSECEPYLLKCFLKVHRGKYGQIHLIASLTAGLSRYHDDFAVAVVDEVGICKFAGSSIQDLHNLIKYSAKTQPYQPVLHMLNVGSKGMREKQQIIS